MITLILLHGGNSRCVPLAVGIASEVVLSDERLLNLCDALGRDGLLAADSAGLVF